MSASGRRPFTAELRRQGRPGAAPDGAEVAATADHPASPSLCDVMEILQTLSQDMVAMRQDIQTLQQGSGAPIPTETPPPPVAPPSPDHESAAEEVVALKTEMRALAFCIEQTKTEIASLRSHDEEADHLSSVASELDAVVTSTEAATDEILDAVEAIEGQIENLKANVSDAYVLQVLEDMLERTTKIFEACNFQDITGQRITKVVRTLQYVDERIASMVGIWGSDALSGMQGADLQVFTQEDDVSLHGPQLEEGGQGISQDEIDKLFD